MASSAQLKTKGLLLLASFFAILFAIFMPLFPGTHGEKINGLDYLDNFFNQLSKSSAYYIPEQMKKAEKYNGQQFTTSLKMKTPEEAAVTAKLFTTNKITAAAEGDKVKVSGDFGTMITIMLKDADAMYKNDGQALTAKYGVDERQTVYSWFQSLAAMEKDMTKAGQFEQAKFVKNCMSKAIEPAYNYYKVEAKPVKEEIVLLIASLAFYVIYTMWYGFGLLYLFEGLGIKLDH
ncbi:hypothetical protein [uncultured Desulfobulbus sp.]|uniref:hypothetical protein n=1 Tax=uncultured Desulfobulbus sp. TaxID=239745 RepID=UPI0029C8C83F|nr:hypothetical protein [uncultured Desulfobulbus sp.]